MDDDDEIHSPTPNGRIAVPLAAAVPSPSPPPPNSLTLALPIQHHHLKTPASGGGREDCWSEGATAVLIDAWGERYLELSRGNLKQKHWKDVADIVNSCGDYTKTPKTDIQCKNRIDTVKKKFKVEKAKIAAGAGPSKWRFFDRLDELIGTTAKLNSFSADANNSNNIYHKVPTGGGSVRSSSKRSRKRPPVDSDDESEPEISADSSDGLPPRQTHKTAPPRMFPVGRRETMNKKKTIKESNWGNSMRELTRAVLKFGEVYEQAETAKLQQLVEMEKQRMKFTKDLELERMRYFMKMQLELSQLKKKKNKRRMSTGTTNNSNHLHVISNNNNAANNGNDNNSGSSN